MTKSRNINAPRHMWTQTEIALLRDLYPDLPSTDIAALLGLRLGSVYQKAAALGLSKSAAFWAVDYSGRVQRGKQLPAMVANQFHAGQVPWNKGLEYMAGGRSVETQFKKGQRPHTWQPIGTYRITADGYLERKVNNLPGANNVRWHGVHRLVWQSTHGAIPQGHVITFKPGTKTTALEHITLDKLECISREELAQRNHPNRSNPELARLVQLKGAITRQVNRITRESKEKESTTT